MRLVGAFLACLIRLSHFSKGCEQGCVEEAYTHSFATGLVEFALRNPRAWLWFNLLLSEHLPGRVQYDRVVCGAVSRAPVMPKRILVAGMPVTMRNISRIESRKRDAARRCAAGDRREAQLPARRQPRSAWGQRHHQTGQGMLALVSRSAHQGIEGAQSGTETH